MTDPFQVWGAATADAPVDPDPAFAAALRARLERALLDPEETPVNTGPAHATASDRSTSAVFHPHPLSPILRVADARVALAFYAAAFGAVGRGEPWVEPDGRVAHVELTLGDAVVALAEDNPGHGLLSPARGGGTGQALKLSTPDPDGMAAAAVAAGATLEQPVADQPYGRSGLVVDPDGHRWVVADEPAGPPPATSATPPAPGGAGGVRRAAGPDEQGLTAYLAVTDARASVAFYVAALGATRRGEPIVMPDGRVGHVEVELGGSVLMLADEHPELGLLAPVHRGGPSQSLRLETPEPDALVAAATAHGARVERPVTDSPHGRGGVVVDPDGHRWIIAREPPAAERDELG